MGTLAVQGTVTVGGNILAVYLTVQTPDQATATTVANALKASFTAANPSLTYSYTGFSTVVL